MSRNMNTTEREELIEKIGTAATDKIADMEGQLEEIREYLKVVRIAQCRGWVLTPNLNAAAS